ncbi:MAG: 50S ribosomal protein L30 [Propionibacteriaceae bacterium]|jgi:large subunit ribosomal protein L30|nr:50S ribosomal protein L30 [Propionibacteriaceae bacterium]
MGKVQVTQTKSKIGTLAAHRATLRTLGLKRIGDSVVRENTREVQGMVRAVAHLVRVEEVK